MVPGLGGLRVRCSVAQGYEGFTGAWPTPDRLFHTKVQAPKYHGFFFGFGTKSSFRQSYFEPNTHDVG